MVKRKECIVGEVKKGLLAIIIVVFYCQSLFCQVLPTPMKVELGSGYFELTANTKISFDGVGKTTAHYLAEFLKRATGFSLDVKCRGKRKGILLTTEKADSTLGAEGYILEIKPKLITVRAVNERGMFYAVQSLLQLFPPEIYSETVKENIDWQVPCLNIRDKPKYSWRSFMLDSGRQFQSPEFIKHYLDIMAMLKMNVFHWHLTEGQGWRLEIEKYPRLTGVGSQVARGKEQQGFYTQKDVKDIVEYARSRHIMVVPEIDVPGHSEAALTAYPDLTCLKKAPKSVMGFSSHIFCGGNEKTYTFLQDMLDEVLKIFPSPYIHLGGDEAPKDDWDTCDICQDKIKQEGLKDSDELQLYFSKRLANYLKAKGRKVIFWGDVIHKGGISLPDNVVIEWWNWRRHKDLAYKNAIKNNYPVIAATNYYSYLNFPVTPWSKYKASRTFDMKTTYERNPSDLADPDPLVLGMSASLWTDWNVQEHMVDRRVFPRIYALAEQMWHIGDRLGYDEFHNKVKAKYPALDLLNIDYGPASIKEMKEDYSWE